jgi:ferric-dicitrate binding protein FerR (iron transport regulator)
MVVGLTRSAIVPMLACLIALSCGTADAASKIGVAAAAQNDVRGTSGATSRAIASGAQVFQDETISTGAESMAQLLFLDETSLSIGPQSEVTLDKFVYNPATGAGDVAISATRGAFRFITGSQKPTNYKLHTAIATIGVRGTIVDCRLNAQGLACTAQEGRVLIDIGGKTYTLLPGQTLFVAAGGEVTFPFAGDGEFFNVNGKTPWPLYGGLLPGEREQFEVPDDSTVRLDEIGPHEEPCTYYYECCEECGGNDYTNSD